MVQNVQEKLNMDMKIALLVGRDWVNVLGSPRPPYQGDAQSDVRSLPVTAEGWKMRHHSPDIKDGPSVGVNIQKRLAGVIKTHL